MTIRCRFMRPRKNKFGAKPVTIDGHRFDSRREAARYNELRALQYANKIKCLLVHVRFCLQEGFTKNGTRFRPIYYEADFTYTDCGGKKHVEDTKGILTREFRIKRKLFEKRYAETIEVVR